ncbi:MAG: Rieske 2Fe-2S domain-containing protein, partial [Myxococcota bacterium]
QWMGLEVVAFRTEAGRPCLSDAFCPHMGAHFGHGGTIEGETLRCPFHGFCFDTHGTCVKTGYDTRPPRKAKLRTWPVREVNGLLLAYHDPEADEPGWTVPALDEEGWTPLRHDTWAIHGTPYDVARSTLGFDHLSTHLSIAPGSATPEVLDPARGEGPMLTVSYAANRRVGGLLRRKGVRTEFRLTKWGLGYSCLEVEMPELGLCSRHFVFPSATDDDSVRLSVAASLRHVERPNKATALLRLLPRRLLHRLVVGAPMLDYRDDVSKHFERGAHQGGLAQSGEAALGDSLLVFQEWAKQFGGNTGRDAAISAAE